MESAENYTVMIKNSIAFPNFGTYYIRNNIMNKNNNCNFNVNSTTGQNNKCHIFRLGDIVSLAGGNFSK